MNKHTQAIRWQKLTNSFSVFDTFLWFALKGLSREVFGTLPYFNNGTSSPKLQKNSIIDVRQILNAPPTSILNIISISKGHAITTNSIEIARK